MTEEQSTELTRWTIHGERVVDDTRPSATEHRRGGVARWGSVRAVRDPAPPIGHGRGPRRCSAAAVHAAASVRVRPVGVGVARRLRRYGRGSAEQCGYARSKRDRLASAIGRAAAVTFQPWVGTADAENLLFLAREAEHTGGLVDVNEAEQVAWIPLVEAHELVSRGEIVGAGTVIAVLELVARKARGKL